MSSINKILLIKEIQSVVWDHFKLDEKCPFPKFDGNEILYGSISTSLHKPALKKLIVSDKESSSYKSFFESLLDSIAPEQEILEYDEEKASIDIED
jgi:hypothetical protein